MSTHDSDIHKIHVDRNNFTFVFEKWNKSVLPSIIADWEEWKKSGIVAVDFFIADFISDNNKTLKEGLLVVLENNHYFIK
ncbi:MAG: hypothetical protein J6V89_02290, partial [Acetobacter sp.]|nr:hypothetical protein [Acetobacter sp.]